VNDGSGLPKAIQRELDRARQARRDGNEGKVRVSARRAAGQAIQAYFIKEGNHFEALSALDYIAELAESDEISNQVREILSHLAQRVVKNAPEEDSYWPLEADLITETEVLIRELLG
jgi:HEPN domain-containing protein